MYKAFLQASSFRYSGNAHDVVAGLSTWSVGVDQIGMDAVAMGNIQSIAITLKARTGPGTKYHSFCRH
ncbi:MAG: hypothetical protein P1U32_05215 [Legionellaceae bacterium]|nr:hypothetical protein [Legionellaceae bacterium]